MNLNTIFTQVNDAGCTMTVEEGALSLDGPVDAVDHLTPLVRHWKPELIKLLNGETVADVGHCDQCGDALIGLLCFAGYINRVCGACGSWAIGLPPDWSPGDVAEHIAERSAIMEHDGQLSRRDADRESVETVRAQFEQQSIFESADRMNDCSVKENQRETNCAGKHKRVESNEVAASPARLTTELPNYKGVE